MKIQPQWVVTTGKQTNKQGDIKIKRLEWTGHLVRMDRGRAVKKVSKSKTEGRRRMERPRFRWLQDVGKGLWKIEVKNGDRKQWTEQDGSM